jgi:hypothetical protein
MRARLVSQLCRSLNAHAITSVDAREKGRIAIETPGVQVMASQRYSVSNVAVPGGVDPAFWNQDLSGSSPLTLQLSPTSSTTQDSVNSLTPPVQTPRSDSGKSAHSAQNGQTNGQSNTQNRASVAVACVPCRSRHLKCDGGVRCSRCRAEGVDCTYIKSRRGWKGKRKRPGENGTAPGASISSSLITV